MRSRRWAAGKDLESRGVQFVTDVEGNESEAWTYFRGSAARFLGVESTELHRVIRRISS
jgi:hypothetical protein